MPAPVESESMECDVRRVGRVGNPPLRVTAGLGRDGSQITGNRRRGFLTRLAVDQKASNPENPLLPGTFQFSASIDHRSGAG